MAWYSWAHRTFNNYEIKNEHFVYLRKILCTCFKKKNLVDLSSHQKTVSSVHLFSCRALIPLELLLFKAWSLVPVANQSFLGMSFSFPPGLLSVAPSLAPSKPLCACWWVWPHWSWGSSGYLGLDNWLNRLPVKEETGRDKCGLDPLVKPFGFLCSSVVLDWEMRVSRGCVQNK